MNLNEAVHAIQNDNESFTLWVMAAGEITSTKESTFEDLLVCLRRKGLPAEFAATALYVRTKRPRPGQTGQPFSTDFSDWYVYLKEHDFIPAMSIDEAKRAIQDDNESFLTWAAAAAEITSSKESSLEDILACMQRRGLPTELAATALYARTNRPRADNAIESFIVDRADWTDYLKSRGLL